MTIIRTYQFRLPPLLIVGLLSAVLTGCIPMIGSYYQPSSDIPNSRIGRDGFSPDGQMFFSVTRGGVTVTILGFRNDIERTATGEVRYPSFPIGLWVPKTEIVRLSLDQFHLVDSGSGSAIPIKSASAVALDPSGPVGVGQKITSGIFDGSLYPSAGRQHRSTMFNLSVEFSKALPENFDLYFPEMEINGVHYPVVVIHYKKVKGIWIQGLM